MLFSAAFTLFAAILALTIPQILLSMFVHDPEVIRIGVAYLRTIGLAYVFFSVTFASNGVIDGSGNTLVTTLISLVSLWVFRVPLAYYLSHRLGSVQGVWYAMAASFVISTLVSVSYYFSGHWKTSRPFRPAPPSDPVRIIAEETAEA